jgi:hypothetical protein
MKRFVLQIFCPRTIICSSVHVKQNNETSGSDNQSSAALPLNIMQPAAPPLNISGIAAQCIIKCLAAQTFVKAAQIWVKSFAQNF